MKRILSLLLVLLLTLSLLAGCAKAEETAQEEQELPEDALIVARVDDHKFTYEEYQEALYYMLSMYGVESLADLDRDLALSIQEASLETLMQEYIMAEEAKERGLDQLSEEELAEMEEQVDQLLVSLDDFIAVEVEEENPDVSEKELELLIKARKAEYAANGYDKETLMEQEVKNAAINALYEDVTRDITVTPEELQAAYEDLVAADREAYGDPASLESMDSLYGFYYIPEGLVRVKHILIPISEDEQMAASLHREKGEETQAENVEAAARDSIQQQAQDMLDSILSGEADFDTLMQTESADAEALEYYPDGYYVANSPESSFVETFRDASFALEKEGDLSPLVPSSFGWHIIRLEEKVKGGAVDFDEVSADIEDSLLYEKQDEAFYAALDEWMAEHEMETFMEAIEFELPAETEEPAEEEFSDGSDVLTDESYYDVEWELDENGDLVIAE